MKFLSRHTPTIALLACLAIATLVIGNNYLWLDTSVITAVFALLAPSVGISYGQAGILSVAQASLAILGAYATAILTLRYGFSPYLSLIFSIAVPAIIAYPVARLVNRLSPLALAMATLFFSQIVDQALRHGDPVTGGYIGLSGVPPLPGLSSPVAMHVTAWLLVIAVVFLYSNLVDSAWGRALATSRYDSLRATADGVDVPQMRSAAFAVAAAVAGLAGWLYAHQSSYLSPDSLTTHQSLSALLMAVVGGAKFVLGPIVGAVLLTLLLKVLPGQEVVGMLYGGALIIVLLAMPNGILGAFLLLRNRKPKASDGNTVTALPSAVKSGDPCTARPESSESVLAADNIFARYGRIDVCHGVSFSVGAGERVMLLGANGAGKSSLLGSIAGLVRGSGSVRVNGRQIMGQQANQRAAEGIAFVPEIRGNIFPTLNVAENLDVGLRLLPPSERMAALQEMHVLFPILHQRRAVEARMLSGGEQQMLAIAMAAARRPTVLMLDEPSQGLAPSVHEILRGTFEHFSERGIALLISEQNVSFAATIGTRCLVLGGGRVTIRGDRQLLTQPEKLAAAFLDT